MTIKDRVREVRDKYLDGRGASIYFPEPNDIGDFIRKAYQVFEETYIKRSNWENFLLQQCGKSFDESGRITPPPIGELVFPIAVVGDYETKTVLAVDSVGTILRHSVVGWTRL